MTKSPARIVVDSGPIIALFDASDAFHQRALEFVRNTDARLLSSVAVATEAMYVLDDSLQAQQNLLAWIRVGGLDLIEPATEDWQRISDLLAKYADLPMDFTDAVVVALCERLGIPHIASVDSDFNVYRYRNRTKFINLF